MLRLPAQPARRWTAPTRRIGCAGPTARRRRSPSGGPCTSGPARMRTSRAQTAEWNRGAYLVRGLGHCSACHSPRNALGASSDMMDLSGGLIPMQNWYAPSLTSPAEAGVADWELAEIERLLQTGVAAPRRRARPDGGSGAAQHAVPDARPTVRAMAIFLKALPQSAGQPTPAPALTMSARMAERGAKLYDRHCADCHGAQRRRGARRLSGAGRQSRGDHADHGQPGAGRAERRLPAVHRRQPASVRDAALCDGAQRLRTWPRCSATSVPPGAIVRPR